MPNRIEVDPLFESAYKKLSKKYPSFESDLKALVKELKNKALIGIPLGRNIFKIRLAINSKGKGKSGGARIITYALVKDELVVLLTAYDKSAVENITKDELVRMIGQYSKE